MERAPYITALILVACGGSRSKPPTEPLGSHPGAAPGWAPSLAVDAGRLTGWLALAPAKTMNGEGWIPVSSAATAVWPSDSYIMPPAASAELVALPARGGATTVHAGGAPVKVVYGCNQPQDSVGFTGSASLEPGVVWLVPSPLPAGWNPAAVELETVEATANRRVWQVGPLQVTETATGGKDGELGIVADGRSLYTEPFESDLPPVDLSIAGDEPGVPRVVAAWLLAPAGPMVILKRVAHEELYLLDAVLVGADGATAVDALHQKLYNCGM